MIMKAKILSPIDNTQDNIKVYDLDEDVSIITDEDQLIYRSDEIDVRKQNTIVRNIILKLKLLIRENNLTSLSAPQIGYTCRIFCINFNGDIRSYINPIIVKANGFELSREKCSSIPNKEYLRPRHNDITVTYMTPLGKIETKQLVGMAAKVFQHSLDHLDGLLLSDIGLEIDENFDNATEEEKNELIKAYFDSLDIKSKEISKEIEEDEDLKKLSDSVKFIQALQKGEVRLEKADIQIKQSEEDNSGNNDTSEKK